MMLLPPGPKPEKLHSERGKNPMNCGKMTFAFAFWMEDLGRLRSHRLRGLHVGLQRRFLFPPDFGMHLASGYRVFVEDSWFRL